MKRTEESDTAASVERRIAAPSRCGSSGAIRRRRAAARRGVRSVEIFNTVTQRFTSKTMDAIVETAPKPCVRVSGKAGQYSAIVIRSGRLARTMNMKPQSSYIG